MPVPLPYYRDSVGNKARESHPVGAGGLHEINKESILARGCGNPD